MRRRDRRRRGRLWSPPSWSWSWSSFRGGAGRDRRAARPCSSPRAATATATAGAPPPAPRISSLLRGGPPRGRLHGGALRFGERASAASDCAASLCVARPRGARAAPRRPRARWSTRVARLLPRPARRRERLLLGGRAADTPLLGAAHRRLRLELRGARLLRFFSRHLASLVLARAPAQTATLWPRRRRRRRRRAAPRRAPTRSPRQRRRWAPRRRRRATRLGAPLRSFDVLGGRVAPHLDVRLGPGSLRVPLLQPDARLGEQAVRVALDGVRQKGTIGEAARSRWRWTRGACSAGTPATSPQARRLASRRPSPPPASRRVGRRGVVLARTHHRVVVAILQAHDLRARARNWR